MKEVRGQENIRDSILDAADHLLAHYGYKKMSMDDLAQELRISKATIYQHFSSKEEVALSRIDRVIDRLKAELEKISVLSETASNRLHRMLIIRVLFRFDNVQHYTASVNDIMAAIRPALKARHKRHFAEEAQIFSHVLEDGLKQGELAFPDAFQTAHGLLLATNSLLPYSLSPQELGERQVIEEQIELIATMLIHGLIRR